MTRIRKWLCKLFSMHEPETINPNYRGTYELTRCKHCGLHAQVHWFTRETTIVMEVQR